MCKMPCKHPLWFREVGSVMCRDIWTDVLRGYLIHLWICSFLYDFRLSWILLVYTDNATFDGDLSHAVSRKLRLTTRRPEAAIRLTHRPRMNSNSSREFGNATHGQDNSSGSAFTALTVIQSVFLALMMIVAAVANSFVCRFILAHRSLRTITNSFIFNLAATDFLLSVLCMPFALVSAIMGIWVFGKVMCVLTGFVLSVLCIASILTLVLVAVDRYLAICRPLKYCAIVTHKKCVIMLVYIWFQAIICAILPLVGWGRGYKFVEEECICRPEFGKPSVDNGYTVFLFIACFVGPFSIISFTYISILCAARKQFRRVHHVHLTVAANKDVRQSTSQLNAYEGADNGNDTMVIAQTPENTFIADEITSATNTSRVRRFFGPKAVPKRRRQKARGVKMLWIIVLVFLICWSPYFVFIFYSSINPRNFSKSVKGPTMLLTFLNSALNPFLYGFLNGTFRSRLREFIAQKFLFCKFKNNEEARVHHITWPSKIECSELSLQVQLQ